MNMTSKPEVGNPSSTNPLLAKEKTRFSSVLRRMLSNQSAVLFLVLVALVIFFSVLRPTAFPRIANALNMGADASILLILAVGSTFVIITRGIDLSVNGVLVFSGVIAAKAMIAVGGNSAGTLFVGLLSAIAAGTFWGLLNGFLVARAKIPPLIVTLGTMGMSFGFALLLTGGIDIADVPNSLVLSLGSGRLAGIPILVIVTVVVVVIGGFVLSFTRFGRYTFAAGSNPEGCRRAGIKLNSHLIKVYVLAGVLAGIGGYASLARFATTTVGGHLTDNLQVIAGVVIGGTSLFGGVGGVTGTVLGIIIPIVLLNGFVVIGLPPFWQQVVVGAVLIAAVYFDQLRRKLRER